MGLITGKTVQTFDLTAISRGDCIRVKRAGDTTFRNGFVTKLTENQIEVLYSNTQNNATSFLQISAIDVAVGVWEIYWTSDFVIVNYHPGAGDGGESSA